MTDKKAVKTEEAIEAEITSVQNEFERRLREIDPELISNIRIGRGLKLPDGESSTWHDNWRDKDRWVKSFGKAGKSSGFDFDDFNSNFQEDE
ncbi:hypothetical protein Y5S_01868 [Alcanivorax nanhaiticus]|uniref:Uncharacterized protein n=1 Tax=Alcanivorax nanhaiticus TaxID=1177154 RepID=A0A095UR09_9GAMM|nr:hypothetical protein [Alcanivorax nanhaiticus]KGD64960.1 hypothetical protein Y5S_01868 [Alcanivorax nanhaiticus]